MDSWKIKSEKVMLGVKKIKKVMLSDNVQLSAYKNIPLHRFNSKNQNKKTLEKYVLKLKKIMQVRTG